MPGPLTSSANIAGQNAPDPTAINQLLHSLQTANGTSAGAAAQASEMRAHLQVIELLRSPPPNKDRQEALTDFIKESNKARRKDRHVPRFSSVKDKDMEKIQILLANQDMTAIHALMRKNRWKTLTLIMGDEVVTLCRPKNKKADMQYVRNCVDPAKDGADSGKLLTLDDVTIGHLASQLMQQSSAQGIGNGTTDPAQATTLVADQTNLTEDAIRETDREELQKQGPAIAESLKKTEAPRTSNSQRDD